MARGTRRSSGFQRALPRGWRANPLRLFALARRRLGRGGPLLAAVGTGMLVAVVLLCAVPLYISLGSDAQLRTALNVPPAARDIEVQVAAPEISPTLARSVSSQVVQSAPRSVQDFAPTTSTYIEGPRLALNLINGLPVSLVDSFIENDYVQLFAYDLAQTRPHMRLLAGRLPSDAVTSGVPEVLATPQSELQVGQTISTTILGINDAALTVRVVGIWFPQDENDPYWNGRSFRPPQLTGNPPPPTIYPLLMTPNAYFAALGRLQPSPGMILHYIFYTQINRLNARNMGDAVAGLYQLRTQINSQIVGGDESGGRTITSRVSLTTGLDRIIQSVRQQFLLSDLPLYIVVTQVIGLALLFVIAMASLLIESQAGDIATLKSRGAGDAQLLGLLTVSGVGLAAVAVVVGPVLAAALSLLLVRLGIPAAAALVAENTNLRYLVQAAVSRAVIVPALAGAALGLLALGVPTWQAAQQDVLAFRREQGRETHVPLWRRTYLDLVLAAFCVVGYLELSSFGGLGIRETLTQAGAGGPTLLLLAAPALLLLAGGLVALRLFPPVLRLGARRAARGRGATTMLAFAQLARHSGRFNRSALLLMLAVAMGIFALTFDASLGRNAADRAAYQTGGDLRVQLNPNINGTGALIEAQRQFASVPDTTAVTGIIRTAAQTPANQGTRQIPLLGIDPATFAAAAYWRGDYADQPLATVLTSLRQHTTGGTAGQKGSPIWALVSPSFVDALHLQIGQPFSLTSLDSSDTLTHFVVGGIIKAMPTLFDTDTGYIITSATDLLAASASINGFDTPVNGPNEYWLRTANASADASVGANLLGNADLFVSTVTARRALTQRFESDPVAAGMTALLLAGALLAAALAVLGGLVQAAGSARQRVIQFAILRTLGLSRRELTNIFLLEQLVMYAFGLVGGLLLGLVLSGATLPYLAFSAILTDPTPPGIPPYVLVVNARDVLLFFAALALAFLLGLLWQRQVAVRVVLDRTLRLGED
ncbi:MAG: FtsX-like permease family protein [Ktedonobacterales bacterium]|nr:FtsX-like permease family protein [Ktedonobacterales bacterium]